MSDIAKMIAIAKKFGGGSSAPAPVVILPETEMTVAGDENPIMTAPNAKPGVGAVCAVTYNGTAYDCPAVAIPVGLDMTGVLLGNSDAMGVSGGNATAPFVIMLFDTPVDDGSGNPAYGMFVPMEEIAEGAVVTLSIVQTGGASADSGSDGGGGGELFVVNATTADGSTVTVDKTYDEIAAAVSTKKFGICCLDLMGTQTLYLPFAVITQNTFVFSAHVPNIDAAVTVNSDGTSNLDFTMLT